MCKTKLMRLKAYFMVLCLATCCWTCSDSQQEPPTEAKKPEVVLAERIQGWLELLANSYQDKNPKAHLKANISITQQLRAIPIIYLSDWQRALEAKVREEGPSAYYTVLIDYIYRRAAIKYSRSQSQFQRFCQVVKGANSSQQTDKGKWFVMESHSRAQFVTYPENIAAALLQLSCSDVGLQMYRQGGSPESLLRTTILAYECQKESDKWRRNSTERRNCERLISRVGEALGDPAGSRMPNLTALGRNIETSGARGTVDCLSSQNPTNKIVENFEAFVDCQASWQASKSEITPSSSMASGDYVPHRDGAEFLRNYLRGATLKGKEENEMLSPEGVGLQIDYFYEKEGNTTITVSEYTIATGESMAGSTSEYGTMIVTENDQGTTTDFYNSDGQRTGTHWEGAGDNSTHSYTASFNENGTLNSEVIQDAGPPPTTTVVEYDENGNVKKSTTVNTDTQQCTSGCDDPATASSPVDDSFANPCLREAFGLDKTQGAKLEAGLDPWITPRPDQLDASELNACLTSATPSPANRCGPSVFLCLEGYEQDCNCGRNRDQKLPFGQARCLMMDCGPNGQCDPATGTCQTAQGQAFPGKDLPLPKVELRHTPLSGLPHEFRSSFGKNLYEPPNGPDWLVGRD